MASMDDPAVMNTAVTLCGDDLVAVECTDTRSAQALADHLVVNERYPGIAALAGRAAREGFDLQVSVEEHMGCGVGTCQGCVVLSSEGEWVKSCTEGPVFAAKELAWPI